MYGIARQYGIRPEELLALNHLTSSDLVPGQTLQLPAPAAAQVTPLPVPAVAAFAPPPLTVSALSVGTPLPLMSDESGPVAQPPLSPLPPQPAPDSNWHGADWHTSDWRSLAMSFMGVPYQFGGSSRNGTDCSGLVLQVFGSLGMKLPRQSAMQAQIGVPVDEQNLQAGDLVFFDTEGRGSVTHVGIYLGNGDFINANSFDGRVSVNQMSQKYFSQRYLGARRVIGVLAQGN
ncbi:peptidoglycan endopeptidase [Deinococcus sp. KNUC1210]|uniref:C40 family peptidase n=1 Tax=Deinococcus sp. KNUC1210 TaxID=2917691 RepID=UPI001EF0A971|nr:LysM peptidoglycan-binding domain-containing C40 family peptidase [Deinococcus sp. KNUC1210]ULH16835.1 peptidoglycan endopeptidase [Deinococcus sp. KNUC1210]